MLNNLSNSYTLVLGITVILLTGLLFGKIAKKLHIPNVTGYLIGGLFIGPMLMGMIFGGDTKGLLGESFIEGLKIITYIELGFIAFSVGCEFKMSYFKQVGMMPVIIAFAESLAAVLFITGGMLLFGLPLEFALAMGAVGGATAPAATIMVLRQYKAKGDLAKTTMSVVAIDDASALIFFGIAIAIIKSIISPSADITITLIKPFIEIFGSVVLGIITGFAITFLMKYFKGRGNRTCLAVGMVFLNIGVCLLIKEEITIGTNDYLELSSLLSCMAMGMVFTNFSHQSEEVMALVDRITPPFVIIFFVLSGADLKLSALTWATFGILAIYLVFRIIGKVSGTLVSAKACKAPPKIQKWLGWGLLPQGGIAIGLSIIVMETFTNAGYAGKYDGNLVRLIVICAVFVSEIFGPLCLKYALIKSGEGELPENEKKRRKKIKIEEVK